ncbi:hypothetical protein NKI19_05140, partial [Mesorhizobium sp. M0751]
LTKHTINHPRISRSDQHYRITNQILCKGLTRGEGKVAPYQPRLLKSQNIDMSSAMEELFGDPAYKGFVLQDRKRLPSRFSARVSGALTSRLS